MAKSETAQIAQLDERIKSLDANIKQLITDVDAFKDRLSKTNSSGIEQMRQEYQSLQKKVEEVGTSQAKTAKKVEEQIQRVSRSRRVDNKILERQNQLLAAQKRLAATGDIGQRFSTLRNSIGGIDFNSILAKANAPTDKGFKMLHESVTSGSETAVRRFASAQNEAKKSVEKTTSSIKAQKSSLESMLPTLRRLASAFGVAFSVQGLVNFGRKLVETRGEFEMQFVAMKQIIGDVDAATKIWNQTMQQALQSPFRAMQLVDYTKKLAAYRIETDKLFDTTKRLADVSAGLGVDMSRLILAYGQVKAANFLRASEIRQFTEAGVNIVGQLSEYFTQLEGRAVSTADVMERVTKRMVLFEDVEEIFKRMTDEGGTFYNMQEVQAETVRGQIMKLHDAYDQMLNTIGQANQGTIRNLIESANSLVRNWRDVASFLMKNVNAFVILLPLIATYRKGAKLAAGETFTWTRAMRQIGLELTFARNGMKKFSISTAAGTAAVYMFKGAMEILKTTFRTFVPFLAIEGLMLLVTKMQAADRAANQLTKDLDEVGKRNAQSLQDNIDGFTNLVERLKRATEGSQDYLDIRNKIQSQYGEYLDNLEAEQITVENLANSYDRVVERMREKSRQHIMEEGLQEIDKAYSDAYLKFTKVLEGTKVGNIKLSSGEAGDIAKKMYDLYSKNPSRYDTDKLFLAALKQYGLSGEIDGTTFSERNEFFKSIEQRYKKQLELETKANSLTKATSDTRQEYLDQLAAQEEHEREIAKIESKTALSSEKKNYLIQAEDLRYQEKKLELLAKYGKKSDEWLDNEKKKLKENYDAFLKSYNARVEAYIGSVYGQNWRESDNVNAFKDYNAMVATQSRIAQGQSRWEESILNDKKVTEENIKRLKEEQATQTAKDAEASKHLNDELKKENHRLAIIKKQMELLGLHEKDKSKGGGSANNSIYGDRIRLLQDMLQKYRQAAKEAYGFAKAEEKTGQSFEDAWAAIMPEGYGELEVPTSYAALAEMLQRLEEFTPSIDKNGKLSAQLRDLKKAIADALASADLELSVRIREDFGRQMEEAFGNYELTLELQKLNLPNDVLSDMFDIEAIDTPALRSELERLYDTLKDENGEVADESFKVYENWLKKIDDAEQKLQRDRLKSYSKYLEYQVSERAKIEMEYIRKVAEVQAESALGGENEGLRKRILEGLDREKNEKLAKQDWEDFKGSEMYIQMMEDLTRQGTASLEIMRKKLLEVRDNAENLSPRALKEVINALEKIDDEFYNRQQPFARVRHYKRELEKAMQDAQYDNIAGVFTDDAAAKEDYENSKRLHDQYENIIGDKKTLADVTKKLTDITSEYNIQGETEEERIANARKMLERYRAMLKSDINERNNMGGRTKENADVFDETVRFINNDNEAIGKLESYINLMTQYSTLMEKMKGTEYENMSIEELSALSKEQMDAMGWSKEEQVRLGAIIKLWRQYNKSVSDALTSINDYISRIETLFDSVTSNLGSFGIQTDVLSEQWVSSAKVMMNSIKTVIDTIKEYKENVQEALDNGKNLLEAGATGDYVRLALALLKVLIDVAAQIGLIRDASYEKQIQKQQERIDALKDAYARLEKQIEKTWSSVSYMQTYEQQVANIREQIDAMEAQMRAEEAKKNTDDNAVRQYQRDIQDAYDQLDELEQKSIEVFGGIGEEGYRSAAEGFVEAWKSAFLETGDGLQGLQDHFNEFLQDWFVKQGTMQAVANYYSKVWDYVNSVVKDGGLPTQAEIEQARALADEAAVQSDAFLQAIAGIFNLQGEGSLSGLAAGIQGMTEEQANILEAYWNSVRMYTASIDMNVSRIAEMLGAGSPNSNPMLQQMSLIAANTQATHQLLQSVTRSGHSLGGYGIKVFND